MRDIVYPPIPVLRDGIGLVTGRASYGTDRFIAAAARNVWEEREVEKDQKLLEYMMLHQHTSPFEQACITYSIRLPIFVARQFMRHRTFKYNEISGRYRELDLGYHVPCEIRKQSTKNHQGSSGETFNDVSEVYYKDKIKALYREINNLYRELLDDGVSREQARIILPVSTYTEFTVTCDLHNLMHFLRLRLDSHAQEEIQEIAAAMAVFFEDQFPITWEAFIKLKLNRVMIDDKTDQKTHSSFSLGKAAKRILDTCQVRYL